MAMAPFPTLPPPLAGARGQTAARLADLYLRALGLALLGYALDGRGFAYLGIPPLFVGEATLLAGLAVLLAQSRWKSLWERPQIIALLAFVAMGICRTVPYLDEYGVDAIRDAAFYYYSAFAIIVAGLLISGPHRLLLLLGEYGKFTRVFLVGIPLVAAAYRFGHEALPRWPWGDIPIVQEKEGDVMVHLGAIAAFWASGLGGPVAPGWSIALALNAACMGVIDRAGLVSFCAASGTGLLHRPLCKPLWRTIGAATAALLLFALTGVSIEIPGGKGRALSFHQVVVNLQSTFGDAGNDGLDSTKEWRTDWWRDIVAGTLHGPDRWTGKGFGVNLADAYGYQVQADHSLRSPHSAHMTVLARMGAPGLALWGVVQLTWLLAMVDAYYKSRRRGDRRWSSLLMFLMAFWLALLINSSFDVFLEGPMGGIWFWTVYGTGVGSLWIYEKSPVILSDESA